MHLYIILFILLIIVMIKKSFNEIIEAWRYSYNNGYSGKTPSQTNELSQRVIREQMEMQIEDEMHAESYCKYSTRDPKFSFEGRPNNYDDFAELRKRNAEHEKHLQRRIY